MEKIYFEELLTSNNITAPQNLGLLPYNFDSAKSPADFEFSMLEKEIIHAFENKIIIDHVINVEDPIYRENRSASLILPIFCVGQLISNNPVLFQLLLNLTSSFLYDKIKTLGQSNNVKMKMLKVNSKESTYLEYEGTIEGLKEITKWKEIEHER